MAEDNVMEEVMNLLEAEPASSPAAVPGPEIPAHREQLAILVWCKLLSICPPIAEHCPPIAEHCPPIAEHCPPIAEHCPPIAELNQNYSVIIPPCKATAFTTKKQQLTCPAAKKQKSPKTATNTFYLFVPSVVNKSLFFYQKSNQPQLNIFFVS